MISIINKITYFIFFILLSFLFSCVYNPQIDNDTIFTFGINPITIEGSNFGDNPRSSKDYLVKIKNGKVTIIDSHDFQILTWTHSQIVYQDLEIFDGSFRLYIIRKWGELILVSKPINIEVYEYTNYPLVVPFGDNGYPLDLEFDDEGVLWVSSEFSKSIYSLDTFDMTLISHIVPQPAAPIFMLDIGYGAQPTKISGLGEDVVVDRNGNVWFTQGGGYLYQGAEINASRVVKYDPLFDSFSCYNIPSNNAQIFGLYIDANTNEVWVSAGGVFGGGNFIARFFPDTFSAEQSSCLYDFRSDFPADFCLPEEINSCFSYYSIIKNPAHLIKISNNNILISQFFGTRITELNPDTHNYFEYFMPEPSGTSQQGSILGSGPWSLVLENSNKLWILEQFDNQIVEFNLDTQTILREYTIPGWDPNHDFAHTLISDDEGNLWFSMYTNPSNEGTGWLGRFNSHHNFEMFPPLPLLGITGGITGLAIHPDSGDIYFGEFWMASIGRLHRID